MGWHFAAEIFKYIYLTQLCCILNLISLEFVLKCPIENKSSLIQVMVSCQMNRQQDITLKRISHFDEIFITGCTGSCQIPVRPVTKISSKWHFHFSVPEGIMDQFIDALCVTSLCEVNSLRPSDVIWRQRSGSILAQVMACCLMAPSHYLNQCWFTISRSNGIHLSTSRQSLKLAWKLLS